MKLLRNLARTSAVVSSFASLAIAGGPQFADATYYNPSNDRHYVLNYAALTYDEANAYAQALGGELLVIDDAAESAWVLEHLGPDFPTTPDGNRALWLGITDVAFEGHFVGPTGSPLTFTNWAAGEPNNASSHPTGEDVVELTDSGTWNDIAVDKTRATVVEIDVPDSFLDAASGKTYLLSGHRYTLAEARTFATAMGGRLVCVSDAAEQDFLSGNLGKWIDAVAPDGAWIGLSDETSEGNFVWESGEPLSFTHWTPGEPNDIGNEDGVVMRAGAHQWNDVSVNAKHVAIVEITTGLAITSYAGPGSIRFAIESPHAHKVAVTIVTFNTASVGDGWFFGINPSFAEVMIQYQSGVKPFVMALDGNGDASFQLSSGVPAGIHFAAVTVFLDAAANPIDWTDPVVYTTL